jgi:ParB family chromosome partitioning protein
MPWSKSSGEQLDLLNAEPTPRDDDRPLAQHRSADSSTSSATRNAISKEGRPLLVPLTPLDEDPHKLRTEFPDSEIDELANDVRKRGILQPIVVHPADAAGRHRIHFGAKRLRAARRAGLAEVPLVVRDAPADPYVQVAENQKRHGLTPLDLARLILAKVNEGETNATIAKRLVMDPTTVAHHLALLDLPPELDEALKSGRCTSPRTLYELSKLHQAQPEQVRAQAPRVASSIHAVVKAPAVGATVDEQPQVQPGAVGDALPRIARLDRLDRRVRGDQVMGHAGTPQQLREDFAVPAEVPAM